MKNSILGSLVGIAIVVALDSLARVAVSTFLNEEIFMFAYSSYGGVFWPIVLTIIAGLSSFLGSLFSISYGKVHSTTTVILFLILIILVRYGQIHLLMGTESLFYPIAALVLSIGGAFIGWQLLKGGKSVAKQESKHHYPNEHETTQE